MNRSEPASISSKALDDGRKLANQARKKMAAGKAKPYRLNDPSRTPSRNSSPVTEMIERSVDELSPDRHYDPNMFKTAPETRLREFLDQP